MGLIQCYCPITTSSILVELGQMSGDKVVAKIGRESIKSSISTIKYQPRPTLFALHHGSHK